MVARPAVPPISVPTPVAPPIVATVTVPASALVAAIVSAVTSVAPATEVPSAAVLAPRPLGNPTRPEFRRRHVEPQVVIVPGDLPPFCAFATGAE